MRIVLLTVRPFAIAQSDRYLPDLLSEVLCNCLERFLGTEPFRLDKCVAQNLERRNSLPSPMLGRVSKIVQGELVGFSRLTGEVAVYLKVVDVADNEKPRIVK